MAPGQREGERAHDNETVEGPANPGMDFDFYFEPLRSDMT